MYFSCFIGYVIVLSWSDIVKVIIVEDEFLA